MVETRTSGSVEDGEAATARKATERLTFFSDAVVAIAITLLAIDLPVPEGRTSAEVLAAMRGDSFEYLAFLISFIVIGTHWRGHHSLFRHVARADGVVVHLSLLWLLLVVVTPFLTRVLSEGEGVTAIGFGLYAAAQALQLTTLAAIVTVIGRRGWFAPTAPQRWARRGWVGALTTAATFAVSIPAFLVIGTWAFALWVVLPPLLGAVLRRSGLARGD